MKPSGAEPALALGVGAHRPQEIDPSEIGPVGLAEIELRMGALPEQEAGQPLLARGADDEIGIWLSLRIEVLGDVLRIDELGEFVERRALARVLLQQRRRALSVCHARWHGGCRGGGHVAAL